MRHSRVGPLHLLHARCGAAPSCIPDRVLPLHVLVWQMVERDVLDEPINAAHLAKLKPKKRLGGKMSKAACEDPEKAVYIGLCCGGTRVWGDLGADIYHDEHEKEFAVFCCGACKAPLPWLPQPRVPAPRHPHLPHHRGAATACGRAAAGGTRTQARSRGGASPCPATTATAAISQDRMIMKHAYVVSDHDWSENMVSYALESLVVQTEYYLN